MRFLGQQKNAFASSRIVEQGLNKCQQGLLRSPNKNIKVPKRRFWTVRERARPAGNPESGVPDPLAERSPNMPALHPHLGTISPGFHSLISARASTAAPAQEVSNPPTGRILAPFSTGSQQADRASLPIKSTGRAASLNSARYLEDICQSPETHVNQGPCLAKVMAR